MSDIEGLNAHMASGLTTVCRAWAVIRKDGETYGFTDHDEGFSFDGVDFKADTGLTASALQQTTGLAVDNSEALGVLSDNAISDDDIEAGRFDGAEVLSWLVNWADVSQRKLQFRGSIGEIQRGAGAFRAELRGLTEALNQPQGRVFQKNCSAVLGDARCQFDLDTPGYVFERPVEQVEDGRIFRFGDLKGFDQRWFERGRVVMQSGAAKGLIGIVKNDRLSDEGRVVELWEPLRSPIVAGDVIRIEAGCDRRVETCRLKFNNFLNFQGFPDIPGEDWLMTFPSRKGENNGGSLR
ncbi:DUF2163 domain-containing protein [Pseudaestuariivita rosea]|uniref:DUF2163 domain-containing protein n=1 Tax=Pseudaestuariivita rosea TaxID=2763263 RepID=UPI001ABABC00|nr:DUF2163 domain-containing protein [Pseudaestuariivita rosea]